MVLLGLHEWVRDGHTNELTSRCGKLDMSEGEIGRRCLLTRLVVHSPQVDFEGADQYAAYQLVVKNLRRDGAVSPATLDFSLRINL